MRTMSKTKLTITIIAIVLVTAIVLLKSLRNKNTSRLLSNHGLVVTQTETPKKEILPQPSVKPAVGNEVEFVKKTESSETNTKVLNSTTDNSVAQNLKDIEALIEPGFYTQPWERKLEEIENLIDVPIKEIAEPSDYSIKFNPTPNRTYRCVSIITSYMNSEEAFSRMVTNNSVSTKSDSDGSILVDYKLDPLWALTTGAELPEVTGHSSVSRQFLVRDGALYLSQEINGERKVEDTQYFDGNIEEFIMDLPKGLVPRAGSQWEVDREEPYPYKATRTLVGFAEVNGIRTAKIHSQTVLPMVQVPGSGPPRTLEMSVDTYVELGTGIVIRTESELGQEVSGVDFKMKAVSQTIPVNE